MTEPFDLPRATALLESLAVDQDDNVEFWRRNNFPEKIPGFLATAALLRSIAARLLSAERLRIAIGFAWSEMTVAQRMHWCGQLDADTNALFAHFDEVSGEAFWSEAELVAARSSEGRDNG